MANIAAVAVANIAAVAVANIAAVILMQAAKHHLIIKSRRLSEKFGIVWLKKIKKKTRRFFKNVYKTK